MPFEKGKSGNPGGRPKEAAEVKSLAQEHGVRAIARLAELIEDEDKRVSVAACQALLDRGYGKPTQQTELVGDLTVAVSKIERRIIDPVNANTKA